MRAGEASAKSVGRLLVCCGDVTCYEDTWPSPLAHFLTRDTLTATSMVSEYELLRQRNMEDNQRTLAELGLDKRSLVLSQHVRRATNQDHERRAAHFTVAECKERLASLRRRAVPHSPAGASRKEAPRTRLATATARAAAARDACPATRVRQKHARRTEGSIVGHAGGWNAGPYVGIAVVRENGSRSSHWLRRIAIRKRSDGSGRLYGYVGRKQIVFRRDTLDCLPCVLQLGIQVVQRPRTQRPR